MVWGAFAVILGMLAILYFLAVFFFLPALIERRLENRQNEYAKRQLEGIRSTYKEMRGWRHDYRHHIQAMKVHAAQGDWEAVRAYLDALETDLAAVDTVLKTGNPMADAILNSKISLARAKHIRVQADASVPVVLALSELDLCVILGNLFDNAIEASLALPQDRRLIRVYIDMKGEQLYISFTNFTAGKKRSKTGGRFRTTKGEGHGFGLVRIDNIVERLGGYITRSSEEGAFSTEILIPVS